MNGRGSRYLVLVLCLLLASWSRGQSAPFHVVALAEKGGIHQPFVDAAKVWLSGEAKRDGFTIEYLESTDAINDDFLAHCDLFLQLNYPPYNWTPRAQAAFVKYIEQGQGGWIGFHHATLLGEFDGFPIWPWFSEFMGGIRFTNYIASFATGTVHVEAREHPVMKGVPATFSVKDEEWYTWDKSPRPNVRVLASVDEGSYAPETKIKMGDHPVVWTNERVKARNVYIFMGHHADLFENAALTTMFHNSIEWTARR